MPQYKDAATGTWYSKFRYKDWTNKTKNKTKRGFKTKREAQKWENEFKSRIAGNIEMSFGEFVSVYREERCPRLKASTVSIKENVIDTKILPYFKDKPLNEITSTDIIKWQNTLLQEKNPRTDKPYSKSYLKTVHNQINAIFNYACRYYKLPSNPASIAGNIGNESEIEMKFWTTEEYKKFAEEMMDEPVAYYAFQCLYWLGIREGEMLALTMDDFDFDSKTVTINKTYQVVKGTPMVTSPKTVKSNRTIMVPDPLCTELKEFFRHLPYLSGDERIFSSLSKSSLYRHIKSGAQKAGIPEIRVHDLRHSHVSLLINMGYSAVAIANRLGHESIHITLHYAHMFPCIQTDMADRLGSIMKEDNDNE